MSQQDVNVAVPFFTDPAGARVLFARKLGGKHEIVPVNDLIVVLVAQNCFDFRGFHPQDLFQ